MGFQISDRKNASRTVLPHRGIDPVCVEGCLGRDPHQHWICCSDTRDVAAARRKTMPAVLPVASSTT